MKPNKDNQNQDQETLDEVKHEVKDKVTGLYSSLKDFLMSLVSVKSEIDYEGSPKRIEEGIKFQGFNVWVLIFSIFIASIGLNSNSTAIIIGAMLISPLMGPIVGVGFSLGTNRFELLKRSFMNFVIMVTVSLITSWLYFLLTPIDKADTEILARTAPTILDVLVAIFGGLAGAIAGTKKAQGLTVIPGVAIATALMPPLCTVGYGLATLQMDFAFGAMYLFTLNSIIISISTTVFVRLIGFPIHTFVNKRKERKAKIIISVSMIVLIVPSIFFFINATRKTFFESAANRFILEEIHSPNSFVITENIQFSANQNPKIEVLMGGKTIGDSVIGEWINSLVEYDLENTELYIIQDVHDELLSDKIRELEQSSSSQNEENKSSFNAMMLENRIELSNKDSMIQALTNKIEERDSMMIDYQQISAEIKSMYSGINTMAFGDVIENTGEQVDTIPTLFINWSRKIGASTKNARIKKLKEWLPVRTHNAHIRVKQYYP
jgi:uncharacterized hydrophobic protein (TIGR00271 family)